MSFSYKESNKKKRQLIIKKKMGIYIIIDSCCIRMKKFRINNTQIKIL